MGKAVLAAEQTVRSVANAVARRVGHGGVLDVDPQPKDRADAAAVHPVAGGIGAELVPLEGQRKPRLRDLDAAELDPAGRLPLTRRLPPVADGRRAAAGASVEHVPDERLAGSRVHALDRDAEAPTPSREHALGARRFQRPRVALLRYGPAEAAAGELVAVVAPDRLAAIDAALPGGDARAGLALGAVEDLDHGRQGRRGAGVGGQREQAALAAPCGADH